MWKAVGTDAEFDQIAVIAIILIMQLHSPCSHMNQLIAVKYCSFGGISGDFLPVQLWKNNTACVILIINFSLQGCSQTPVYTEVTMLQYHYVTRTSNDNFKGQV